MSRTAVSPDSVPPPSSRRRHLAALAAATLTAACLVTGVVGGLVAQSAPLPAMTPAPSSSTAPSFGRQCLMPPLAPGVALWVVCWHTPTTAPDGPWEVYRLTYESGFQRVSTGGDPRATILSAPRPNIAGTFFVKDATGLADISVLTNVWSIGGPPTTPPPPPPSYTPPAPTPTPTSETPAIRPLTTPAPSPVAQPSAPVVSSCGTATSAAVCWDPVTAYAPLYRFDVFRKGTTTYEKVAEVGPDATRADLPDLPPGNHTLYVAGFDVRGNVSPVSAPLRVTVEAPRCDVRYRQYSWAGGFTAEVMLTNTGPTPVEGWTLAYDLPAGAQVTSGWNAGWSQSGTTVTAADLAWNTVIPPGGTVSIGTLGTHDAPTGLASPTAFTLDGATCSRS